MKRVGQSLIVFARYPECGKCKTRLISQLGPQGATELHAAMMRFTLAWASEAVADAGSELQVHFAGGNREVMQQEFGRGLDYVPQCAGDLGQKLREAVSVADYRGIERVVIVGTDCPQLDENFARLAFDALHQHDVCVAPASDGGYTLLGVRTTLSDKERIYDALFDNISWGSGDVLRETVTALGRTEARVRLLPTLSDVDYPDDLVIWERAKAGLPVPRPSLSVIIPVVGCEERLPLVLKRAGAAAAVELIVVAADSCPRTLATAAEHQAQFIVATKNRSKQMNLGAASARGEILIFLHADTILPEAYEQAITRSLEAADRVGGAFGLGIDSERRLARLIEWGVAVRSRVFQLPYGDQAIFVRHSAFEELHGFADQPIMEDYDFVRRLRKLGRISICEPKVSTSPRRWHRLGFLKTTLVNQLMIAGYHLGVSTQRLAKFYRGE